MYNYFIIDGQTDSGNLTAGDPTDVGGGPDIIFEIVVGPNTTLQNRLVRRGLPSLIILLSDVGYFNTHLNIWCIFVFMRYPF